MKLKTYFGQQINFLLIFLTFFCAVASVSAQDDPPKSRDIVPVFETSRPPAKGSGTNQPTKSSSNRKKRLPYKRISSSSNSGRIKTSDRPGKKSTNSNQINTAENRAVQVGVTLWQLNEVRPASGLETIIDTSSGRNRYLLPERVSIDTIFQPMDRVRLGIESSRRGYVYIVDQEMYADGTMGEAHLIFPSPRIRRGANLSVPGKPIELPDLAGNPFYFVMRPSNRTGKTLSAEILTVIITDRPIGGLQIGETPPTISDKTLAAWRTKWAGNVEIFEAGGNKVSYTRKEREAAEGSSTLSPEDPLPETVFLVKNNRNGGTLITVPLWYGKE